MADIAALAAAGESIVNTIGNLFGTTTAQTGTTTGTATSTTEATRTGATSERLILDQAAITRIIEETLGSAEGLASIFGGEQNAGIFNSSVSAQAAGDLAAKLVGELAKLTAEKVGTTTQAETQRTAQTQDQKSTSETSDKGVLSGIGDFFGF